MKFIANVWLAWRGACSYRCHRCLTLLTGRWLHADFIRPTVLWRRKTLLLLVAIVAWYFILLLFEYSSIFFFFFFFFFQRSKHIGNLCYTVNCSAIWACGWPNWQKWWSWQLLHSNWFQTNHSDDRMIGEFCLLCAGSRWGCVVVCVLVRVSSIIVSMFPVLQFCRLLSTNQIRWPIV